MIIKCCIFLFIISPIYLHAEELLLFGGSGNNEFLGCLNCTEYDANSVWNDYSVYGWGNKYGKWNPYGSYGGKYSSYSPCNAFSSNGPVIVDRKGISYGVLTINEYAARSVCGISGSSQICTALKVMCSRN